MHGDPRTLFGRRVAQLRNVKGWSQERLSLESGIARSYLGGIERGQRNVALLNICRIAQTLEVPVGELFLFEALAEHEVKVPRKVKREASR